LSAQDDGVQGYALSAVFGAVALVLAAVIALACFKLLHIKASQALPLAQPVYFEPPGERLTAGAAKALARIAEAARENRQLTVQIAGVRGAQVDTAADQRRVLRVHHALEADGVQPAQLLLGPAVEVPARADAKETYRVDVTLR
jgi:hypothetical protein